MIEFLSTYYKEIIVAFLCVVEVILTLITLIKKSKMEHPLLSHIFRVLPIYIRKAEKFYPIGHGDEKKSLVLSWVKNIFDINHCDFDSNSQKIVSDEIENILSAPTKKGD